MAIYAPGVKFRSSRLLTRHQTKRSVVVVLSLTAMVDMFTVLVIFLLQNYNVTGQVLFLPKEVQLPKAEKVKDLEAGVAVTISLNQVYVDKEAVVSTQQVRQQSEWLIPPVHDAVSVAIRRAKQQYEERLDNKITKWVSRGQPEKTSGPLPYERVTVQADKNVDFLTLKKILYSITEAGAKQVNFAVLKGSRDSM